MSRLNIIADAGSTKTDWILADESWHMMKSINTGGINAMQLDEEALRNVFSDVKRLFDIEKYAVENVYFYGAGCTAGEISRKTSEALKETFNAENVEACSDMLGAARALLGKDKGIACILGTGSNSCLYDGKEIVCNVPPLGYLLGDEGSGVSIGRRLIADLYRGILPSKLREHFERNTGLTLEKIYAGVYRSANPREILASIVPYIAQYKTDINEYSVLVAEEFRHFLRRNVALYPEAHILPVGFVGGVAEAFADILADVCRAEGFQLSNICRRPITDLLKYHSKTI